MIYKDEKGDENKFNLSSLVAGSETLTVLSVKKNDNNTPTDTTDDFDELTYKDEKGTENKVDISGLIKADNGLAVNSGTVQLGGALTKPTAITTNATNTLAIAGLEAPTATDDYDVVTVDNTSGVLKKMAVSSLSVRQYVSEYNASQGDQEFDTPKDIKSLENIDVYRNGLRIDFVQVDSNTIKLNLTDTNGCFANDQIRIVQLQ